MPGSAVARGERASREAGDRPSRTRIRIGQLWIDAVTFDEALDEIAILVRSRCGGMVFTPNVDHVMIAETRADFRDAYERASLSLADGMPLLWASRLLGTPLPEKVSGSDLVTPLAALAAKHDWAVYLLGGAPGVADTAAARLHERYGVRIVGCDAPTITLEGGEAEDRPIVERIRNARPDLVLVAFGAPKQELWMRRVLPDIQPAVAVGVGASLDFVAGTMRRAPRWVSSLGFEWLYRLGQEPRRLWRRYLVRDPVFLRIVLGMLRLPRRQRVRVRNSGPHLRFEDIQ